MVSPCTQMGMMTSFNSEKRDQLSSFPSLAFPIPGPLVARAALQPSTWRGWAHMVVAALLGLQHGASACGSIYQHALEASVPHVRLTLGNQREV